jgi:cellulose synthase/poly-beta-1,6-N-acetylglucosamine synthase-like glycosyltransferase
VLFAVFAGSYGAYFGYLKLNAGKGWGLKLDPDFSPSVTILVPAHNEGRVIQAKLENLAQVSYPREKMEIMLIDDASTDNTLEKAREFVNEHPELPVKILEQSERKGKAGALNKGLEVSSNDVVVVTDADSLWPADILQKALPYVSDPTVGALSGRGVALNSAESWVTRAEKGYLDFMTLLRLGESKVHSTIRFEGSFCIFKRKTFDSFDSESGADDSGTALRVIQNGYRAIFVPEAYALSEFPDKFTTRTKVKVRRAVHLTGLWLHCLKLLLRGRLMLPKRIAVPEIFLSIFNPIIFVALACATFVLVVYYPFSLIPLILGFCLMSLIPKVRSYFVQGILDQFILFYAIALKANKKKIVAWEK